MLKYENHCCDCAVPGYPCLGKSCPNREVEVHYCDVCGCEIDPDERFEVDGDDLCHDCLVEKFIVR